MATALLQLCVRDAVQLWRIDDPSRQVVRELPRRPVCPGRQDLQHTRRQQRGDMGHRMHVRGRQRDWATAAGAAAEDGLVDKCAREKLGALRADTDCGEFNGKEKDLDVV